MSKQQQVDPIVMLEGAAARREELARVYGGRAKVFEKQAAEMRQTAEELRRIGERKETDDGR